MNRGRRVDDATSLARRYLQCMQAIRQLVNGDPDGVADVGVGIVAAVLTAVAAWIPPPGLIGATIAGPAWLRVLLPLIMGLALMLRRRAPLLAWLAIWGSLALQDLLTQDPPHGQGLAFMFVLYIAAYSLGAHAGRGLGIAGLVVTAPVMGEITDKGGLLAFSHSGQAAVALSLCEILAFWLTGVLVRARRQAAALAMRSAELQRQAEQAAADERARIARELHDSVAHYLTVIVLQAAGTRASGRPADAALEKIELSGRQALTETRRLLGVLRNPVDEFQLTPQPGIGELDELAASVRASGVPVNLAVSGDRDALPAAVDVSVYRIVQEALTNVLKHAGPARADVTVACAPDAVTIGVTDNGAGEPDAPAPAGGHGLTGMRERTAVFGGELAAGPRPGGGFAVQARLPFGDGLPLGDAS
jgi:signal transduction histidine kinase